MKIWAKTKDFSEGKFLVVRRDGSTPHWPHFVLGARDPFAPIALRAYCDAIDANPNFNYDKEYVASIRELANDFEAYRNQQGDGDPDAPPHRHDDADVLSAMTGNDAIIYVRPDNKNTPKP